MGIKKESFSLRHLFLCVIALLEHKFSGIFHIISELEKNISLICLFFLIHSKSFPFTIFFIMDISKRVI